MGRHLTQVIVLLLALIGWGLSADAQLQWQVESSQQPVPTSRPADGPKAQADEADNEKEADEEESWLAIEGATVHTVSGPVLEGATVLVKDRTIEAIGTGLVIPEDATRLDATGHHLFPGLIAVRSSGIGGRRNPASSSDVFSLTMTLALAGGLTTAVSDNQAIKVTAGTLDGHVLRPRVFETLSYTSQRPNERRGVREGMARIQQYLRDVATYQREKTKDPKLKAPDKRWIRGNYSKYLRLLEGKATALGTARTWGDILAFCALVDTYRFRLVLDGVEEGWAVAPDMARSGISAILTPRVRVDENPATNRPSGSSIANALALYEGGVRFAIVPQRSFISTGGRAGRDLLNLNLEAAFAVRGGLSQEVAIRALTLDAARIVGIDDRVGSIEVGKDADFAIVDGDLLHYQTLVRWTVVNGRLVYDRMKDTLFDHIRPVGDPDAPPVIDGWPRELGEDF